MPSYTFTLNGQAVTVDAPADMSLLWVLRDKLGVTGPKYGCGVGVCRACTCHLGDAAFTPCTMRMSDLPANAVVTTIEGLAINGALHPVQQAWIDCDVAQCGFCQGGQIMSAVALLRQKPNPTDADIDTIENVCRCGTYPRVKAAIKQAAGLPADETLFRTARREPVPRLVAALELGAARLKAGEPWASCLRGTPLDTSVLADLTALAGKGAKPIQGLRWAAGLCREQAMQGLRRAVASLAVILLLPPFLYLLILLHAASVTAAVAQVESIRFEMESLTDEVDQILRSQ